MIAKVVIFLKNLITLERKDKDKYNHKYNHNNMPKQIFYAYSVPSTYTLVELQDGMSSHKIKTIRVYVANYSKEELGIKKNQ